MAAAMLRSFSMKKKDGKDGSGFGFKRKGKSGQDIPAGGAETNVISPRESREQIPMSATTDAVSELSPRAVSSKNSGGLLGMRSSSIKGLSSSNKNGSQFVAPKVNVDLAKFDDPATALVSPSPGAQGTANSGFSNPLLSSSHSTASSPSIESMDSELAAKVQELAVMRKQKMEADALLKAAEEKWKVEVGAALAKVEEMKKAKEDAEARLVKAGLTGDVAAGATKLAGKEVEQENESLRAEPGSLKLQLDIKASDCEALEKQVGLLKQENAELTNLVQELKEKLMDNLRTAEAKISALRAEKSALEARLQQGVSGSGEHGAAADVAVLHAEKAVLEEKLKHATATAEAAALASLQMQNEKKEQLTVEETLRKELGAAELQLSQLKSTYDSLEEQVALLKKEKDDLQYQMRWGQPRPAVDGDKMLAPDKSLEAQLEKLKQEKAATENELRKELDAAALQLSHLLTDKAMLEEKLWREMRMQEEMWRFELQTMVGQTAALTA